MTRFTNIGLSGRKDGKANALDVKKTIIEIDLPVVASATAQTTDVFLPPSQVLSAFIYVTAPEVTGGVKNVAIGFAGGSGDELLAASVVSGAGIVGAFSSAVNAPLSTEITYTLGSADFAEMKARLVLEINSVTNI